MAVKKEAAGRSKAPVMLAMQEAAEKKFGRRGVFIGDDADRYVPVIPVPQLAWRWISDSNGLFVGKPIGLAGEPESRKSGLGFEFLRWICDYAGGCGKVVECEGGKVSPDYMAGILGGRNCREKRVDVDLCASSNEAQSRLTWTLDYLRKRKIKDVVGLMLDSLTGSNTERRSEKIFKDGSADKAFGDIANSYNEFFKTYSGALIGRNIVFLFINHMKMKQDAMGNPRPHAPGGESQFFHASQYFWTYGGGQPEDRKTWVFPDGREVPRLQIVNRIRIKNAKNSMGVKGRWLRLPFITHHDEETDRRVFRWDWDAAAAQLLAGLFKEQVEDVNRDKLAKVCDVAADGAKYHSKRLGIHSPGVPDYVLGRKIQSNPEMVEDICHALHITYHPAWDGRPAAGGFARAREEKEEEGKKDDDGKKGKREPAAVAPDMSPDDLGADPG
jgi:hypothetical protein